MKILVIGKNGQLASSLRNILKDKLVTFSGKNDINLDDLDIIESEIIKINPEIIINTAAYTNVDGAEKQFELASIINEKASIEIAKASKKLNIPLIHISTDYVFDGSKIDEYSELDETRPLNKYGMSKLNGEIGISLNCSKAIIIRTSWLFSSYGNNFLKTIFKKIYNSDDLKVIHNQVGKPTSSLSLAKCIKEIVSSIENGKKILKNEVYHFANYPHCSWYDFSLEIKTIMDKYIKSDSVIEPVNDDFFKQIAERPKSSILCSNKIEMEFGIKKNYWSSYLETDIKNLINNL